MEDEFYDVCRRNYPNDILLLFGRPCLISPSECLLTAHFAISNNFQRLIILVNPCVSFFTKVSKLCQKSVNKKKNSVFLLGQPYFALLNPNFFPNSTNKKAVKVKNWKHKTNKVNPNFYS